MKYGFIPPFGDACIAAELAYEAEQVGWDVFLSWNLYTIRDYVAANLNASKTFDIVIEGDTPGNDRREAARIVTQWADAGATWWLEAPWDAATHEEVHKRICQGPPGSG